jgi:hypothetical protein
VKGVFSRSQTGSFCLVEMPKNAYAAHHPTTPVMIEITPNARNTIVVTPGNDTMRALAGHMIHAA